MNVPRKPKRSSRRAWLPSVLCLGLVGCQATGSQIGNDQPKFSRLAGRWWVSLRDLEQIRPAKKPSPDELKFAKEDRLLVVSILPDGSFDWSRTFLGISLGIHELRDVGDRCIAHKPTLSMYEVVASEYTPTRSMIEFRLADPETVAAHLSERHRLEISLRKDGGVDYTDTALARGVAAGDARVLTLHGARSINPVVRNTSRISGSWSADESGSKLALIIRSDGTFNWSGTGEAQWLSWHQLEQKGDHSCNMMRPDQLCEVTSSKYTPATSSLRFHIRDRSPKGEANEATVELTAQRIDDTTIHVSFDVDAGDQGRRTNTMMLHKNTTTQLRVGSMWDTLLGPWDSQDSDS